MCGGPFEHGRSEEDMIQEVIQRLFPAASGNSINDGVEAVGGSKETTGTTTGITDDSLMSQESSDKMNIDPAERGDSKSRNTRSKAKQKSQNNHGRQGTPATHHGRTQMRQELDDADDEV